MRRTERTKFTLSGERRMVKRTGGRKVDGIKSRCHVRRMWEAAYGQRVETACTPSHAWGDLPIPAVWWKRQVVPQSCWLYSHKCDRRFDVTRVKHISVQSAMCGFTRGQCLFPVLPT